MTTKKRQKEITRLIEDANLEIYWIQIYLDGLKRKVNRMTKALRKDIEPSSS